MNAESQTVTSSWFQRYILPGLAFKAVVIGGGYATGRELVEFFLPSGPRGALLGMATATLIWSAVCATTFLFARHTHSQDYRTFFRHLLGPLNVLFESAYVLFLALILAVFGAAAGAIGAAMFGWPKIVGALVLAITITIVATYGNAAVERLFKWVSFLLYGVFTIFLLLALSAFGNRVSANFALDVPTDGWALGGLTYAGYNVVGAVVILPALRHLRSGRDAVVAGALAGPLAMIPAVLFLICMVAFYPEIGRETLPSDFLLQRLNMPFFHLLFQTMIFGALLESGTGCVHAVNERVANAYVERRGRTFPRLARFWTAVIVLVGAMFVADRFGLVTLIARGYRGLAWVFLAVYVLPLMSYGVWRLARRRNGRFEAKSVVGPHGGISR